MKRSLFILVIVLVLVSACIPSNQTVPTQSATATATAVTATPTATDIPPTVTSTPTPTLAIPVGQQTPVPSSSTRINTKNVDELQEIARYYGKISYSAKLTKDEKILFILDPERIIKYDYESMEPLASITVLSSAEDLQVSTDGTWAIVDNNILLDLRNENEPKQFVLSDVLDFHPHIFVLSPDGSMVAAQRYNCPNLCDHELLIVSTKDFSVLHRDVGPTLQKVFVFSPDGMYFAVADRVTQENPDGSTGGAGGVISVWTTGDFTKVLSIPVRFPFEVSSLAISEDNTTIAVSQRDFIDIFDMASGEPKDTIDDLCFSYQRKIMFVPSSPPKLLEQSECSSRVWAILDNSIRSITGSSPDFSKAVFSKNGEYKTIPYPQPMSEHEVFDWFYFTFPQSDVLSFQNRHSSILYSCDLTLSVGSYDCQNNMRENINNQVLGKARIVATDGKHYEYVVSPDKVDIFSPENKSKAYYSLPFRNYVFNILALDPINKLIIYEVALTTSINKIFIRDMESDRVLAEYEGQTFISSLVLSGNRNYAAFCRTIGYNNRLNKDKLVIFDLVEKKIIYNETFSCGFAGMALTHDGSKLAILHPYLKNPTDSRYSGRLLIFNTQPPYDRQSIDVDATQYAAAFSPDDSLLAVFCGEMDICFFDVATNTLVSQLKVHSQISNIAFSPDGNMLATYSRWGLNSLWAIPPFTNRAK